MIMDVIDRPSQLIVGESGRPGQPVSDLRVGMQNSRASSVEQTLNKKVSCRVLDFASQKLRRRLSHAGKDLV